jgi:hypothetical protein
MPQRPANRHAIEIGAISSQIEGFDRYNSVTSQLLFQSADRPTLSIVGVLGAIVEVLEVAQQGRDAIYAQIARNMFNLESSLHPRLATAINDFKREMSTSTYMNRPELWTYVARYKAEFKEGRRVVLVPHSQGNFFANEGYNQLFVELGQSSPLKKSMGIVGLATPTGLMADGRDLHVKFANDWIRCVPPTSLAPNLGNASTPPTQILMDICLLTTGNNNASELAHWPDTYLYEEDSSKNLLKSHLARLGTELEYPPLPLWRSTTYQHVVAMGVNPNCASTVLSLNNITKIEVLQGELKGKTFEAVTSRECDGRGRAEDQIATFENYPIGQFGEFKATYHITQIYSPGVGNPAAHDWKEAKTTFMEYSTGGVNGCQLAVNRKRYGEFMMRFDLIDCSPLQYVPPGGTDWPYVSCQLSNEDLISRGFVGWSTPTVALVPFDPRALEPTCSSAEQLYNAVIPPKTN